MVSAHKQAVASMRERCVHTLHDCHPLKGRLVFTVLTVLGLVGLRKAVRS